MFFTKLRNELSSFFVSIKQYYLQYFIFKTLSKLNEIAGYKNNKNQTVNFEQAKQEANVLLNEFAEKWIPKEHKVSLDEKFEESKYGRYFYFSAPFKSIEGKNTRYIFCSAIVDKENKTIFLLRPTKYEYRTLLLYDRYRKNLTKFFQIYEDKYIEGFSEPRKVEI